jgi:hypothetical protein
MLRGACSHLFSRRITIHSQLCSSNCCLSRITTTAHCCIACLLQFRLAMQFLMCYVDDGKVSIRYRILAQYVAGGPCNAE